MNLDELKFGNTKLSNETYSKNKLAGMIHTSQHPILKRIRIQLTIETIGWSLFLALYYNLFDGHLRSPLWNGLLILAICLLLIHNLMGYRVINQPVNGLNILESLRNYVGKVRKYAMVSISTKVLGFTIILGYFMSTLSTFQSRHYWGILIILIFLLAQVLVLWRIWSHRINQIQSRYEQLANK